MWNKFIAIYFVKEISLTANLFFINLPHFKSKKIQYAYNSEYFNTSCMRFIPYVHCMQAFSKKLQK